MDMTFLTIRCLPITALTLLAVSCLAFSGCGGNKSYLEGDVTLDGKPVPGCSLVFTAVERGPGGGGIADANGHYKGYMSRNNRWLAPGEYQVEILSPADMLAESESDVDPNAMRIPSKYQGPGSELKMILEPGSNTVDFHLTSE